MLVKALGASIVTLPIDSQLLVKQASKEFVVKEPQIGKHHEALESVKRTFDKIEIE